MRVSWQGGGNDFFWCVHLTLILIASSLTIPKRYTHGLNTGFGELTLPSAGHGEPNVQPQLSKE